MAVICKLNQFLSNIFSGAEVSLDELPILVLQFHNRLAQLQAMPTGSSPK